MFKVGLMSWNFNHMSKIVFIADFFANEVGGGGELNNQELVEILRSRGAHVLEVKSNRLTPLFISECSTEVKFIVSNFVMLSEESKTMLQNDREYIIYEHDHKYVRSRNPANYDNFIAPKSEIINFNFYKNAKSVLCQSKFHANIVKSNLELDNIISLGGNLWSEDSLGTMFNMSKVEARMMGLMVITNNLVGATGEEWFSLKGEDLIEVIKNKRTEIPNIVEEKLYEQSL